MKKYYGNIKYMFEHKLIKKDKIVIDNLYLKEVYDISTLKTKKLKKYNSNKKYQLKNKFNRKPLDYKNKKNLNFNFSKLNKYTQTNQNLYYKNYNASKNKSTQFNSFNNAINKKAKNKLLKTLNMKFPKKEENNLNKEINIQINLKDELEDCYKSTKDSNYNTNNNIYKINIIKEELNINGNKKEYDHSYLNPLYNLNLQRRIIRDLKYFSKIVIKFFGYGKTLKKEIPNEIYIYDKDNQELFNINIKFDLKNTKMIMSIDLNSKSEIFLKKSKKLKYKFYFQKRINNEWIKFGFNDINILKSKLSSIKDYIDKNNIIEPINDKNDEINENLLFKKNKESLFNFEVFKNNIKTLKKIIDTNNK